MFPLSRVRRLLALVACIVVSGACLDARRLNANCQWTGDRAFAVDWANATHRSHLMSDVRIAGENAVRFGDAAKPRVGIPASAAIRFACLDTLYAQIAANHDVNRATIDRRASSTNQSLELPRTYAPRRALRLAGLPLRAGSLHHRRRAAVPRCPLPEPG